MGVAELASQGSDRRKRARFTYKTVCGLHDGLHDFDLKYFDPKYKEAAATNKQEIAKARGK